MGRSSPMQEEEPVIIGPYVAASGMGKLMRQMDDYLMDKYWQAYPVELDGEEPLELILEDFHMHDIRTIIGYARGLGEPLGVEETIRWFDEGMGRKQMIAAGEFRGLKIAVFIELVNPMMIERSDSTLPASERNQAYSYAYMISLRGWDNVSSGSISQRQKREGFQADPPTKGWTGMQRGYKSAPEAMNAAVSALDKMDYQTYENETASIAMDRLIFTETGRSIILPLRRLYAN